MLSIVGYVNMPVVNQMMFGEISAVSKTFRNKQGLRLTLLVHFCNELRCDDGNLLHSVLRWE